MYVPTYLLVAYIYPTVEGSGGGSGRVVWVVTNGKWQGRGQAASQTWTVSVCVRSLDRLEVAEASLALGKNGDQPHSSLCQAPTCTHTKIPAVPESSPRSPGS